MCNSFQIVVIVPLPCTCALLLPPHEDQPQGHYPGELRVNTWLYLYNSLKLTCDGVVTLISGTKLSSNKLMMFSCCNSFVGVSLGRGGTGGPFLS